MPSMTCANCGHITNTACCNHLEPRRADGMANYCYARFVKGVWIKGCGYEKADPQYERPIIDKLIKKQ